MSSLLCSLMVPDSCSLPGPKAWGGCWRARKYKQPYLGLSLGRCEETSPAKIHYHMAEYWTPGEVHLPALPCHLPMRAPEPWIVSAFPAELSKAGIRP